MAQRDDWLASADSHLDDAAQRLNNNINDAVMALCLAVGDILRALKAEKR